MIPALGLTVLRQIPVDFIPGLLSGAYSLHGGVLRDGAGRIVAHLITSGPTDLLKSLVPGLNVLTGLVGNGQLFALSRSVEVLHSSVATVLQVSAAATALSGLGLVANAAGVAYLSKRLGGIERHLAKIEQAVEDLKRAVVTHHLASLKSAMDNLRHAEKDAEWERKRGMLLDAKRDFQVARHYYLARLRDASTPQEFEILEECLTLAFIGAALTASELQMFDVAAEDFEAHLADWRTVAREFIKKRAVGEAPEILLDLPPSQIVASDLVHVLDFVEGEVKGWTRIDVLREAKHAKLKTGSWVPWGKQAVPPAQADALRIAKLLYERSHVLDAQAEHFRFLAARQISARTFTEAAQNHLAAEAADSLCLVYRCEESNIRP